MPRFTEKQLQILVILVLPNRKILAVFLQGIFLHILSIRSLLAKVSKKNFKWKIFEVFLKSTFLRVLNDFDHFEPIKNF